MIKCPAYQAKDWQSCSGPTEASCRRLTARQKAQTALGCPQRRSPHGPGSPHAKRPMGFVPAKPAQASGLSTPGSFAGPQPPSIHSNKKILWNSALRSRHSSCFGSFGPGRSASLRPRARVSRRDPRLGTCQVNSTRKRRSFRDLNRSRGSALRSSLPPVATSRTVSSSSPAMSPRFAARSRRRR